MFEKLIQFLNLVGEDMHINPHLNDLFANVSAFLILVFGSVIVYYIMFFAIKLTIHKIILRTPNSNDDLLIKNKVFLKLCLLIPAYLIRSYVGHTMPDFPKAIFYLEQVTRIYETIIWWITFNALINTGYDYYNKFEIAKSKPIKSISQVLKVIVIIVCLLFIIAILLKKEVTSIFIGLGTASAITMLIFKDSILGFIGGIQLSIFDMVRIDDWIQVNNTGADGNVIEINLTTVKVQNWNNTITTIPTYSLVSQPFTNWRGMSDSGGRRIMRHINIDVDSVKFCTPEMLERFKKFQLIRKYIEDTEKDIETYNQNNHIDNGTLVNGRRQTNIGIFRAYLVEYLKSNSNISKDLTLMVRQLQPTDNGIPIEIYVFSLNKEWVAYESIQSDIFDHVFAVVPMFDLKIYQRPSSNTIIDIAEIVQKRTDHTS